MLSCSFIACTAADDQWYVLENHSRTYCVIVSTETNIRRDVITIQ